MAELDIDAIASIEATLDFATRRYAVTMWRSDRDALVAELRRLRAVRDAAANLQEQRPDCDGSTYTIIDACREIWPDDPADWCATCVLVHCLEADR